MVTQAPPPARPQLRLSQGRLAALDNVRGLIMILMALDHASLFVAHRHGSEFWQGPWTDYASPLLFLTRFVTHLCAPGFFFLMGSGMYLFASSRRDQGWSEGRITRYFLLRGALLVLLNHLLESHAWALGTAFMAEHAGGPAGPGGLQLTFTVLSGLGMVMMAGALLLRLGGAVLPVSVALILVCNALMPDPAHAQPSYPLWIRLLLLPGSAPHAFVLYPLLPWLGVCGAGIALGRVLASHKKSAQRLVGLLPLVGLLLIAAALGVRYAGGFGNLRLPRHPGWMEFLNFIKYPPALPFVLFMLGTNLVLLGALRRRLPLLATFGQAPLCFYFVHLYLYATLAALFFRHAASLPVLYAVWLLGLIPLYVICQRFRRFKESKPAESLWRLF